MDFENGESLKVVGKINKTEKEKIPSSLKFRRKTISLNYNQTSYKKDTFIWHFTNSISE
jgi:hypothetical protein